MSQRDDLVDDLTAIATMWARRCKDHPMLEVEMRIHMEMLSRLDKELRGPSDGRKPFDQDIDAVMAQRYEAIVGPSPLRKTGSGR